MMKRIALLMLILSAFASASCSKGDSAPASPPQVGDTVFGQSFGHGDNAFWEEAKVTAINGDMVTVQWVDAFAKSKPEATFNSRMVKKMTALPSNEAKKGATVMIHPNAYKNYYKGKIVEKKDDKFTVEFSPGTPAPKTDTVSIDSLWKY